MDHRGTHCDGIGSSALLDAETEVRLAQEIEAGAEADRRLASPAPCSPTERDRLRTQSRRGRQARDEFVTANLRLVAAVARRYQGRGVDTRDLLQEGNLALIRAVGHYDWRRGFRFSTYAIWSIRQAVRRAVDQASNPVRLPARLLADGRAVARARSELEAAGGRAPTTEEVAEAAGLAPEQVEVATACPRWSVSLSTPVGEDDTELGDLLADQTVPSPESATIENAVRDAVRHLVERLPSRSARVLRLRYGLDGGPLSLDEVASRMSLSRERVRQVEQRALASLRSQLPSGFTDLRAAV